MRIVYVIDSLASKGGAERILTDKMNYEATHWGYEVWVVTCYQQPDSQSNVYPLSPLVHQVDLGIDYYSQYRYRYPRRLWAKWATSRRTRRELSRAVIGIRPDVVVGVGYFLADVVSTLACGARKVIESHEARQFTMSDHGLGRSLLSRLAMRLYRWRYFSTVERHADVVVTLTQGDARAWRRARRVEVIPNFTLMPVVGQACWHARRVLAVGRLEWQKGFDRLIDAWAIVGRQHPDWRLCIFGEGTQERQLRQQIERLGVQGSVALHPFTAHIASEYAASTVFALTSRFEGFGLVLLEAMQHALPCVVMDCPYGPADVVEHGHSGFVVGDGDVAGFAAMLSQLMEDDKQWKLFAERATERARAFSADAVMQQWHRLFGSL